MPEDSSSEPEEATSSSLQDEPTRAPSARPPTLGGHGDEDMPPPPRRQHKYSTADMKPERPWKRWCLICLAFLVMIAIMVLISIFLQKLFNPPEDEDWSDDKPAEEGGGQLTGKSKLLPKSSEYLNDVCARDRLDMENREACVSACAPSIDCCNPFKTENSTCFEEQLSECVDYSICHALDGFKEPPHSTLDRVCSYEEVMADPTACETACQAMKCCLTDVDSCLSTSFQACLDYAPCQNLKLAKSSTSTQFMPIAPTTLSKECSEGRPTCIRDCKDGAACTESHSVFYRDNFVACLTYATCNQHEDASTTRIKVAPIYSRLTEAPEDLKRVCLESYVQTTGPHECTQACGPSRCCFADGSASCFGDDPLGCLEYRMCAVLNGANDTP